MHHRRLAPLLLALLLVVPAWPADPAPAPFADGDTVAFVGDSITHSGRWHSYVGLYYLTRFPERRIRFVNAGISGDSAGGALQRLDWDVLPHRPNVVSIMLGMNDIGRGNYGKDDPDAATLEARRRSLEAHRDNMIKLADALDEALSPRFILCTPSPYDETVENATPNLFGCNGALGTCAGWARELAAAKAGGVVDFHGPMTALNATLQANDPTFTLIGGDRVHPGDPGHLLMAYLFLKAQGVPATVSRVALDGDTGAVTGSENASVSDISTADGLAFTVAARALPFPVPKSAEALLGWVPFSDDLNQEILQVAFAQPGTWRLSIDGTPAGDYSAEQLRAGINLATVAATPQAQQAQALLSTWQRRHALETRLRSYAQVLIMLKRANVDIDDAAAVDAWLAEFLEQRAGGNSKYFAGQFDNYRKTKDEQEAIRTEMDQLQSTAWQQNQPQPHRYELMRAP